MLNLSTLKKVSAQILRKPLPVLRRDLYRKIDFSSKLIGIKGARGAGKSTLLLQYAAEKELPASSLLYVSCDHPAMAEVSLYDVAEAFYALGGEVLIIDEIHKSQGFSKALKSIYDVFDLQILFSGSSALRIDHESADLSRRAVIHTLEILSLREFVSIQLERNFPSYTLPELLNNHYDIAVEITSQIRPLEQMVKYTEYGCYPFFLESISDYPQKLTEVITLTIESDLSAIYHIDPGKVDKLKKLLYMLCSTSPYELNLSKISSATGVSRPTLSKYLERMDAGSLIHIIRAGSGMRAVNRPDKLVLDNPNLFNILCAAPDIGSIRESFFVSSLNQNHQVHYHNQGDFIIDDQFVFEVGGKSKTTKQLKGNPSGYVAADNIEIGDENKIPLWMFGFII